MKAIIEGFKYDTDTATFVTSYNINSHDKGELYRNRKYKFFSMHMIEMLKSDERKSLDYEYKIIPLTKNQAMNLLLSTNRINEYEKIFGEIPEPEGEDYVPEDDTNVTSSSEHRKLQYQEKIEKGTANTKPIRRIQKMLCKACYYNDLEKAKACMSCGAVTVKKAVKHAIINENAEMVDLLLHDNNYYVANKDINLSILKNNLMIFKLLISQRQDYLSKALKLARKYLIVDIVEFIEKL